MREAIIDIINDVFAGWQHNGNMWSFEAVIQSYPGIPMSKRCEITIMDDGCIYSENSQKYFTQIYIKLLFNGVIQYETEECIIWEDPKTIRKTLINIYKSVL